MERLNDRIEVIDGFRGLAILSVVLFHYYTRLENIGNSLDLSLQPSVNHWFSYGYSGVLLFFAISGFVICQTLEKTENPKRFFKHRLIRLLPCMIICSTITFAIVWMIDPPPLIPIEADSLLNFLPSWSFTSPEIWNKLLNKSNIDYIDSSYWSLWVEVMFYTLAGALFYINKERFLNRWLLVVLIITLVRFMTIPSVWVEFSTADFYQTCYYHFLTLLNLKYWIYFSIGIFGFQLYKKRIITTVQWIMFSIALFFEFFVLSAGLAATIIILSIILLFTFFVKRPQILSILGTKSFSGLGLISYPLYLIHQNLGLILIYWFLKASPHHYFSLIIPLIVICIMIAFSHLLHFYFERPVMKYLRSVWTHQ